MNVKKVLSLSLAGVLGVGLLAGCGGSSGGNSSGGGGDTGDISSYVSSEEEGKVINIWSWNDEFKTRLQDFYPEVESTSSDGTVTTLKDGTEIHWTENPNQDGVYQDKLDEALGRQMDADADDRIDLFLAETDYLVKYIDADIDVAIPLETLGIDPDTDLADQYQYTKDAATSADGLQRATSWQACPGLFIYRRSIAQDVWGTDDPEEIGAKVADWDAYNQACADLKEKGYYMTSVPADTERVYTNNVSAPWVAEGSTTIVVDENAMKWVEDTKKGLDEGYIHSTDGQWADTWNKDQGADAKVFGFFGPAWLINFTLQPHYGEDAEPDWGVCEPPQSYNWGGSFLVACTGTDNPEHIKDIMLSLTADKDNLLAITAKTLDYTNTVSGMNELAEDDSYGADFLCGENPYKYFAPAAEGVVMDKLTPYDQGCVEALGEFGDYFNGTVDLEGAKKNFETKVMERYPEITEVQWPD